MTLADLSAEPLPHSHASFPPTRYQGSKLKLLPWLSHHFSALHFETVLDAFGGTASVSYHLKQQGKTVTYNDLLRFNALIGTALVANSDTRLDDADLALVLAPQPGITYDNFIARTFEEIFFTQEENRWLDTVSQNIPLLANEHKRALAYYALFQSCIVKRPYNLFHRANLYMRTADVPRSFGNKTTWDTPFSSHFTRFAQQANAAVFNSGKRCAVHQLDCFEVPGRFDLVYIDPPYMNRNGIGVDYLDFYHFLEGLTDYHEWQNEIDYARKHRPLLRARDPWTDRTQVTDLLGRLIDRFKDSALVISYRSDGVPTEAEIVDLLSATGKTVQIYRYSGYKYVLSKARGTDELLFIAR